MTKNPIINALMATLYIVVVASVMFYGPKLIEPSPKETVIIPIMVISLFTLSAAVMGYLFFYQPFQIYFEGDKKRAVKLFLQTVLAFAIITALILIKFYILAL
jgi:heme O synthase-like polyprenyltransferase